MNQTEKYPLFAEVDELMRDFQGLMKDLYAAQIDPTKLINKALCRAIYQDLDKLRLMNPEKCCVIRANGDAEVRGADEDQRVKIEELMERVQKCNVQSC